jgi:thiopurine S-methyltransferase
MDPSFWHDRWENQDIGFHQADIHALLPKYWPRLELGSDAPVFVPLCGKSLDMVWLAQQGHRVIGAELSQRAIDDFFAERRLAPTTRASGSFTIKSAGPYELWCGDFFDLPRAAVAGVAGVYDRAALIALPPSLRERYAGTLTALLPPQARILLITLEYEQTQMSGPPFSVSGDEVRALFAGNYQLDELECRDVLDGHPHFKQRGLTGLGECAYLLRRK